MLIMARHGESVAEHDGLFQGQMNSDLTNLGRNQAQRVGDAAREYEFDAVYSSDLGCAMQTADIILGRNKFDKPEVQLISDLRERSAGLYEGRSYLDLHKELPPKKYKLWQRDYFDFPPQGESMYDTAQRVLPFLRTELYPRLRQNQTILLITHDVVMKVILADLSGMEEADIPDLRVEVGVPYFFYNAPHMTDEEKAEALAHQDDLIG